MDAHLRLLAGENPESECIDKQYFFSTHSLALRDHSPFASGVTCGMAKEALIAALRGVGKLHYAVMSSTWLDMIRKESGNPTVQSFLVEHMILDCIQTNGLVASRLTVAKPSDAMATVFVDYPQYHNIRREVTLAVPQAFNFKYLDGVLIVRKDKNWVVYVIQVTLSSPQEHKDSLAVFNDLADGWNPPDGEVEWHFVWISRKQHFKSFLPLTSLSSSNLKFTQHSVCFSEVDNRLSFLM